MASRRCSVCGVDWPDRAVWVPRTTHERARVALDVGPVGRVDESLRVSFDDCPLCGDETTHRHAEDAIEGAAAIERIKAARWRAFRQWWDESRPEREAAWRELEAAIEAAAGVEPQPKVEVH